MTLRPIYQKPHTREFGIRYMTDGVYEIFSSQYVLSSAKDEKKFNTLVSEMFQRGAIVRVEDTLMTQYEFESLKNFLKEKLHRKEEKVSTTLISLFIERLKAQLRINL